MGIIKKSFFNYDLDDSNFETLRISLKKQRLSVFQNKKQVDENKDRSKSLITKEPQPAEVMNPKFSKPPNACSLNMLKRKPIKTVKLQPIKTVKIQPIKTVKIQPIKTVKQRPIQTVKKTPIQTVKQSPIQTVKQRHFQTVKQRPFQTVKQRSIQTIKQRPIQTVKQSPIQTVKHRPIQTVPQQKGSVMKRSLLKKNISGTVYNNKENMNDSFKKIINKIDKDLNKTSTSEALKGKRPTKSGKPEDKIHLKINTISCPYCDHRAKSQSRMKYHLKTHSTEKLYCSLCDFSTIYQGPLTNHLKIHFKPTSNCAEGSYSTDGESSLASHESQHIEEDKKIEKCKAQKLAFHCSQCDLSFHSLLKLTQHKKVVHSTKPPKSSFGKTTPSLPTNLKLPLKISNSKVHQCGFCNFSSKHISSYYRHLRIHRR